MIKLIMIFIDNEKYLMIYQAISPDLSGGTNAP